MIDDDARDQRIAAYLDGQMDPAQAAAFEAELGRDAELSDRLMRWGANDDLLRAAFAGSDASGADAAFAARVGLAEPAAIVAANDNASGWQRWRWPTAVGVAAAVMLAVLIGMPRGDRAPDDLAALDRLASLERGGDLVPLLTARAADGRFCREFIRPGGRDPGRGIACRSGTGWTQEAFVRGGIAAPDEERMMPAAGPQAAALDRAYERLGLGDPLTNAQEKVVIAGGWK